MEKTDQKEVEYMNKLWIDTRLQPECMKHLADAINNVEGHGKGNYLNSRSSFLKDKDNWFYDNFLKELTEQMFYQNWDNYYKYHIVKKEPLPKFELEEMWVNHQKQHEFSPLHRHFFLLYVICLTS